MAKLQANIILEILGRPQEHVTEALNGIVAKLGTEKGVKILDKTCHEPLPVQDSKDLFTSFAEVMLELDSLENYLLVLFGYMPANIELIAPEKITLSNIDLNDLGNKLVQRLHNYDAITKKVLVEHDIVLKKLQEVAPHLFQQPQQQAAQQESQDSPYRYHKTKC